jgi:hypothetical protein
MTGQWFEIGSVMAKIVHTNRQLFLAAINDALIDRDPRQNESLLPPFQVMKHGVAVA